MEVLVVVVILGLLAAVVVPNMVGRIDEAKRVRAKADIRSLSTAVKLFKRDTGRWPTPEEGLKALVEKPDDVTDWKGYLEGAGEVPTDPWGNPYRYFRRQDESHPFEIVSYGQDGEPGGENENADISSLDLDK